MRCRIAYLWITVKHQGLVPVPQRLKDGQLKILRRDAPARESKSSGRSVRRALRERLWARQGRLVSVPATKCSGSCLRDCHRIASAPLNAGQYFHSIYTHSHSRMPRLTPSLSPCSYVRSTWGLLHNRLVDFAPSLPFARRDTDVQLS